jgi:hypothetical protein
MASPPVDPFVRLPANDSVEISSRDFEILQRALRIKGENESLLAELASLRTERDEAVWDVLEGAHDRMAALAERDELRADCVRLREALGAAMNELGVPGVGYPAPVANAYGILLAALAGRPEAKEPLSPTGLAKGNGPKLGSVSADTAACVCGEINTRHCPVHGNAS